MKKKMGTHNFHFYEQFFASDAWAILNTWSFLNLSFLTTAVARGTEVYSYAVISQFFEL